MEIQPFYDEICDYFCPVLRNCGKKFVLPQNAAAQEADDTVFLVSLIKTVEISGKIWGNYRDIFFGKAGFPPKVWYNDIKHVNLHMAGRESNQPLSEND